MWALVIVFVCGHGCGEPAQTHVGDYPTHEACHDAGLKWLSPAADPQHVVRSFECRPPKRA